MGPELPFSHLAEDTERVGPLLTGDRWMLDPTVGLQPSASWVLGRIQGGYLDPCLTEGRWIDNSMAD